MLLSKYVSLLLVLFLSVAASDPVLSHGQTALSLQQVIERVRTANRYLIQTGLLVESGRYTLKNARSDFDWKIRPVANVGISGSKQTSEQASGIAGSISKKNEFGIETSFSRSVAYVQDKGMSSGVGVSLAVPLFGGFGKDVQYDKIYAADFALQSSKRTYYLAEVEKVLETVTLVYEILRQQSLIKMFSMQRKRLEMHVATVEIKEKTGVGNQIDTYRARIRLKDVQNQVSVAQQKYKGGLDRLKALLAMPVGSELSITAPMSYTPTRITNEEAEKIALANRAEIQQADADYLEAKRKSRVFEKRINPDLKFVASYRKNTFLQGLDATESYYGDYWSVGLTTDTDVSRSSQRSAFKQSLLNVRREQLKKQNQSQSIIADIRSRLLSLQQDEKSIQFREEQIVQAQGKRRLAEIKFSHGMGGNFDLIEAETELQRAQTNLLQGQTNYIVGQYRLRAALGTLVSK